jgi:hypothetical protein
MRKFFKIVGIVLLTFLLLLLTFLLLIVIKSRSWETKFVSNLDTTNLVNEGSLLSDVMNEKIQKYILSTDDNDFITFSPVEVAQILYGSIYEMLGENSFSLTNVYVQPQLANWKACARFELKESLKMHSWICVDVTKDNIQTAQLYLKDIQIQGFELSKISPKLLTLANQGMAEALTTANENGFVGRIFENIELKADSIVVKGSLY